MCGANQGRLHGRGYLFAIILFGKETNPLGPLVGLDQMMT